MKLKSVSKKFANDEKAKQIGLLGSPIFEGARSGGYAMLPVGKNKELRPVYFPFILVPEDSIKNLYAPIRQEVLDYFERYDIAWWNQSVDHYFPTGQLLSSQNHCLNHLFAISRNKEAVLSLINSLTKDMYFDEVYPSPLDNLEKKDKQTYITFEFANSNETLLQERMSTRGANCTSVDAMIYAHSSNGKIYLIPIEWKYTESYDMKYAVPQWKISKRYKPLTGSDSNLTEWVESLYSYDPYYEFARQELLMEQIIKNQNRLNVPIKVDDFLHVIVCPEKHTELRSAIVEFQSTLRDKRKLVCKDPQELLVPLSTNTDPKIKDLIKYLEERYWN